MRISLKLRLSLLVFCIAALETFTAAAPTVKPNVARLEALFPGGVQQEAQSQKGEATSDSQDEVENEDLAPAAMEIDVSGADARTIVEYVTALCAQNVPTVLWWSGINEQSRPAFYALLPLVTTLLVDSSGGTRDDSALRMLAAFHQEHPEVALRDLILDLVRVARESRAKRADEVLERHAIHGRLSRHVADEIGREDVGGLIGHAVVVADRPAHQRLVLFC